MPVSYSRDDSDLNITTLGSPNLLRGLRKRISISTVAAQVIRIIPEKCSFCKRGRVPASIGLFNILLSGNQNFYNDSEAYTQDSCFSVGYTVFTKDILQAGMLFNKPNLNLHGLNNTRPKSLIIPFTCTLSGKN